MRCGWQTGTGEGNEVRRQEDRRGAGGGNAGNRAGLTRLMQGGCGGKSRLGRSTKTQKSNPERTAAHDTR